MYEWNFRPLERGIEDLNPKIEMYLTAIFDRAGTAAEGWMKENAPWTDRTSNARNSLRAKPSRSASSWFLDLMHGMPYGVWLEVRWAGKYSIVRPALGRFSASIFRQVDGMLDRLR